MPIPTRRLKTKVISSSEVLVLHGPNQLNQQHRHAHCHMKTVEARQHEKGGAINARIECQTEQYIGFVILRRLQTQENQVFLKLNYFCIHEVYIITRR